MATAVKLTQTLPAIIGTIPKYPEDGFHTVPKRAMNCPLRITGDMK
jgi:hypothetical protein